jgi:hypothetical protein
MYNLVFIALITSLFTGCSSQAVLMSPTASLRFVGENVHVNVAGQNIDQRVLDQLMREIKGQLIIAGFDIETKDAKSINLKVQVTEFTPGNTASLMP